MWLPRKWVHLGRVSLGESAGLDFSLENRARGPRLSVLWLLLPVSHHAPDVPEPGAVSASGKKGRCQRAGCRGCRARHLALSPQVMRTRSGTSCPEPQLPHPQNGNHGVYSVGSTCKCTATLVRPCPLLSGEPWADNQDL